MAKGDVAKTHKSKSHKHKDKHAKKPSATPAAVEEHNLLTITTKAVGALKQYFEQVDENAVDLVEKRRQVLVYCGFNRCPENFDKGYRPLRMKNVVNVDARALLIVKDEAVKELLEQDAELSAKFQLIIDLTTLKNNFSTTQSRLNLFKDFDAFFCDHHITAEAVGFLGHKIRHSWRHPAVIKVPAATSITDMAKVKADLLDGYAHITAYKVGEASCATVRIGALEEKPEALAANLVEVVWALRDRIQELKAECDIESIQVVCADLRVQLVEPTIKSVKVKTVPEEDEDKIFHNGPATAGVSA